MLAALAIALPARAGAKDITVSVFWQAGCPHCADAKETLGTIARETLGTIARETLGTIARETPELKIDLYEISEDRWNAALFLKMVTLFEIERPAVPFVVIGDRYVLGHAGGGMARSQYLALIERCQAGDCVDLVDQMVLLSNAAAGRVRIDPATEAASTSDENGVTTEPAGADQTLPKTVNLPILGDITLATLSLPVLTVVLAGIDGFNPCAMWVLVLLIGLLAGVADQRRMWTLGLVFLAATGVMYFGVMAAWLNVVLWAGALIWLRLTIGALAVGAGLHYLRDYWTNPEGVCEVTTPGSRKRISDAFRSIVRQPNLLVAAIGIAGLAIVVNLIELVCSAGVPAVYTQILAMRDLSPAAYYGYLLLYLAVFLLDDAIIFATAMLTLRSGLITGRYTRISHAIGGGLLLCLGAVMILRPDWLA